MIEKIKIAIIKWSLNQIRKISIEKPSYQNLENYGIEDIITNKGPDSFYTGRIGAAFTLPKNEIAIIIKKEKINVENK